MEASARLSERTAHNLGMLLKARGEYAKAAPLLAMMSLEVCVLPSCAGDRCELLPRWSSMYVKVGNTNTQHR